MLTRVATDRRWKAVLVSDCTLESSGVFTFKGFGGSWSLVFSKRCGLLLDLGMARLWVRTGMRRVDSPDGSSLGAVIPCVGWGLQGHVLSLASVYGPVSGAGFDQERRDMFESLFNLLAQLPFCSLWVVGGDFNAEIGFKGVGEEGTLGVFAHGRRTRSGHQMMEWTQGEVLRFLLSYTSQRCRDTWFHPKSLRGHPIDHLLVGRGIIVFWAPLRSCLKIL